LFHYPRRKKINLSCIHVSPFVSVDGVGPANMSRASPDKNSQLDLRPFGVGVPVVGGSVVP